MNKMQSCLTSRFLVLSSIYALQRLFACNESSILTLGAYISKLSRPFQYTQALSSPFTKNHQIGLIFLPLESSFFSRISQYQNSLFELKEEEFTSISGFLLILEAQEGSGLFLHLVSLQNPNHGISRSEKYFICSWCCLEHFSCWNFPLILAWFSDFWIRSYLMKSDF